MGGFKEPSVFQNYKKYSRKISYRFTKIKWSCWTCNEFPHDRSSPENVPHMLRKFSRPESESTPYWSDLKSLKGYEEEIKVKFNPNVDVPSALWKLLCKSQSLIGGGAS